MKRQQALVNGVLGLALISAGGLSYVALQHDKAGASQTSTTVLTATRGDVTVSVSGTGNIVPAVSYDVTFPSAASSALVTDISVKAGDKVVAGQVLAHVDDTALKLAVQLAQAQVASAQATLDKDNGGLSVPERDQLAAQAAQSAASVDTAAAGVANAQTALANDTKLLQTAVDQAAAAVPAAQAKATQDLLNQQSQLDAATATVAADNAKLANAQAALAAAAPAGQAAAQQAVDAAQAAVQKDQTALISAQNALASLQLSAQQSVVNAQNALANAINNRDVKLINDQQAIATAQRQVSSSQAAYAATVAGNQVKLAPATPDVIGAAQATLANAQNALATAQKNLAAATLIAPANGTITALNGKVGATPPSGSSSGSSGSSGGGTGGSSSNASSASSAFVSMTDLGKLQLKVGFSEADATKVNAGQNVNVSFDSLPTVRLTGKVASIDVTSTTVSNVVTYYAYVALDTPPSDGSVKPGMTATAQVVVQTVSGVIELPTAAVSTRGTQATVNVEVGTDPNKTNPVQITIGLRGDSAVEVQSGLNEGDKVVIVRTVTTAAPTAATTRAGGTGGLGGGTGGGFNGGGAAVRGG